MSASPIAAMFDRISPHYDRLNHGLSLNIDKLWRRKTARLVAKSQPQAILHLATGTADLAIALARHNPQAHITGVDFSEKMLAIGRAKVKKQHLESQIELLQSDAASLPLGDDSFDAVTCAFGVRNFERLDEGLSEISRVLKPDGQAFVLEFSMPKKFPVKQLYGFYFRHILPKIGKWVSKEDGAYAYLPKSVEHFPEPDDFKQLLAENDLGNGKIRSLTFGIAMLYSAVKIH